MKARTLVLCFLPILGCTGTISSENPGASGATSQSGGMPAATSGGSAATAGGGAPGAAGTPEGTPSSAGAAATDVCAATEPALTKPRVWRLTRAQIKNTLSDQFGFVPPAVDTLPSEARLDGFANRASELKISPLLADGFYQASEELAADVVANATKYGLPCAATSLAASTCLDGFLNEFGQKIWRRPLTQAEVTSFTQLYTTIAAQSEGPAGAVKGVVQAFFLSPNFLHRSELGTNMEAGAVTPLTDYEIASALSYTLWDTAPDSTLFDLAKQAKLRDQTVLADQVKRMFAVTAKASSAMHHFLQQWLFIDNLLSADKDMTVFPLAVDGLPADLLEENRLFMNSVFFDAGADRSFKTLFTGSYGFVNSRTAPLYGIQGVSGPTLTRREQNPAERRGILTLPSFMWAHADPTGTRLVDRGAYFRAEVLCDRVPPPPGGVIQEAKFAPEDATGREKFAIHSEPACAGCHRLFDGIGFAMENYDSIGKFQTTDHNKPIDPSGVIPLPSRPAGPDLAFTNFVDLVNQLANEPDIYSCFAAQYFTYSSGRNANEVDACEKKTIAGEFVKSEYEIDALILAVVDSPSFLDRRN